MRKTARQQQIENLRRQQNSLWSRDTTPNGFFDDWEREFDRSFKRTARGIAVVWIAGIIGSLIFWGVVIWAIIELVQHFTS